MAASSPYESAPTSVINPVATHTASSSAGLRTCPAISADTIKMPEPIIEPITIIVESTNPSPFSSPVLSRATPVFVPFISLNRLWLDVSKSIALDRGRDFQKFPSPLSRLSRH